MPSNFSCVGLDVANARELRTLLERILPQAVEIGRLDGLRVLRWEDPSGARLVLGVTPDDVLDLLPSFAGVPRTRLHALRMANDEVATAAVIDDAGEQLTSAALEVEERRLLPRGAAGNFSGALVALGVDVSVFESPEAFERSDASLLSSADTGSGPPAEYVERGWKWPPRVAASSFFSYGVFGHEADATAHARLSGIVSTAERRVVQETGQSFFAAVVMTTGFEVTVCLESESAMPVPGGVISGTVFMTASLDGLTAPSIAPRRGFFRRR